MSPGTPVQLLPDSKRGLLLGVRGWSAVMAALVVIAVLAKIFVLIFIVVFIQKRPQGLFALKGRSAES